MKPVAGAAIATRVIEALGLDASVFLEDYTTDEFKAHAQEEMAINADAQARATEMADRLSAAEVGTAEANLLFTESQTQNTMEDNARALTIMLDKHYQEWADIAIKSGKEGVSVPEHPSIPELLMMSKAIMDKAAELSAPQEEEQLEAPLQGQELQQPI